MIIFESGMLEWTSSLIDGVYPTGRFVIDYGDGAVNDYYIYSVHCDWTP